MASKSKIEWTNASWNPVIGCTKVSDGCQSCYAEKMAASARHLKDPDSSEEAWIDEDTHGWNGEVSLRYSEWCKPRRIFVCSMSDLFHLKVPFEFIGKVFGTAITADWHTYQFLTKRIDRAAEFAVWLRLSSFKNIWLGVTIENQKLWAERIIPFDAILATGKYISFEPLLSKMPILPSDLIKSGIKWVIIGCESLGQKAGRFQDEFADVARYIVDVCNETGVAPFVKQIPINGKVEHDINKFPKDLQVRAYPKSL